MYSGAPAGSEASASTVNGLTVEKSTTDKERRAAAVARAREEQQELAERQEHAFIQFMKCTEYGSLLSSVRSQLLQIFGEPVNSLSLTQIYNLTSSDKAQKKALEQIKEKLVSKLGDLSNPDLAGMYQNYHNDLMTVKDFVAAFGATASSVYLAGKISAEEQMAALQEDKLALELQIEQRQEELKEAEAAKIQLVASKNALEASRAELELQVAGTAEENVRLQAAKTALLAEIQTKEAGLRVAEQSKLRLEAECAHLGSEKVELETAIQKAVSEKEVLQFRNTHLEAKIQGTETELASLEQQLGSLRSEKSVMEIEKITLEKLIVDLKARAERERAELEAQLERTAEEKARLLGKNQALNETIGGLETRVRENVAEILRRDEELNQTKRRITDLTFQLEQSRLEISRHQQGKSHIDNDHAFFGKTPGGSSKPPEYDKDKKLKLVLSARKFEVICDLVENKLPETKENSEHTNLLTKFIYALLWNRHQDVETIARSLEHSFIQDLNIIRDTTTQDDTKKSKLTDTKYNTTIRQVLDPTRSNKYLPCNLGLARAFESREDGSAMPEIRFEEQDHIQCFETR